VIPGWADRRCDGLREQGVLTREIIGKPLEHLENHFGDLPDGKEQSCLEVRIRSGRREPTTW
jgi:hypothetical protein